MAAAATPQGELKASYQIKNTFIEVGEEADSQKTQRRSSSLDCPRTLPSGLTCADGVKAPSGTFVSLRAAFHQATTPSLAESVESEAAVPPAVAHVAASLPPGYSITVKNEGSGVENPSEDTATMLTSASHGSDNTHLPDSAVGCPGPVCEVEETEIKCARQLPLPEGNPAFMRVETVLPPGGSVTVRNTAEPQSLLATQPGWTGSPPPLAPWSPQTPQQPQATVTPQLCHPHSEPQLALDAASRTPVFRPPHWAASGVEPPCSTACPGPGLVSATFAGSEVPALTSMHQSTAWSTQSCAQIQPP